MQIRIINGGYNHPNERGPGSAKYTDGREYTVTKAIGQAAIAAGRAVEVKPEAQPDVADGDETQ
jgi:hypothetical protein